MDQNVRVWPSALTDISLLPAYYPGRNYGVLGGMLQASVSRPGGSCPLGLAETFEWSGACDRGLNGSDMLRHCQKARLRYFSESGRQVGLGGHTSSKHRTAVLCTCGADSRRRCDTLNMKNGLTCGAAWPCNFDLRMV